MLQKAHQVGVFCVFRINPVEQEIGMVACRLEHRIEVVDRVTRVVSNVLQTSMQVVTTAGKVDSIEVTLVEGPGLNGHTENKYYAGNEQKKTYLH